MMININKTAHADDNDKSRDKYANLQITQNPGSSHTADDGVDAVSAKRRVEEWFIMMHNDT